MTTITTPNTGGAWSPDIQAFAASDVIGNALLLECSTVAGHVEGDQPAVRVGYVNDDQAQFTAEGSEIPEAAPQLAEVLVHTAKVTQLVRVSREQYQQASTAQQLSASVARAITRRADLAFVDEPAPTAPAVAPVAGILNVPGIVEGGPVVGNLDGLVDLLAELQDNLATPTHILVGPKTWAELRKLKVGGTDTNESLLGAGVTDAAPMLLSLPVLVNPALPEGRGLVVDKTSIVSAAGDVKVATSEHQYFTSDSVALRATFRFGHVVVRPERIGTFTVGDAGSV